MKYRNYIFINKQLSCNYIRELALKIIVLFGSKYVGKHSNLIKIVKANTVLTEH